MFTVEASINNQFLHLLQMKYLPKNSVSAVWAIFWTPFVRHLIKTPAKTMWQHTAQERSPQKQTRGAAHVPGFCPSSWNQQANIVNKKIKACLWMKHPLVLPSLNISAIKQPHTSHFTVIVHVPPFYWESLLFDITMKVLSKFTLLRWLNTAFLVDGGWHWGTQT